MQSNVPFEAYQLGNEVATFTTFKSLKARLVQEAIFVAVGIAATMLGVRKILPTIMLFLLFMMIFALAVNSFEIFRQLLVLNRKVQLFENGFIFKQGQKSKVVQWSDIKTVTQYINKYSVNRIPVIDIHRYTITTKDNQSLVINRLQDGVEKLGYHIQVQAANCQLPDVIQALARGEDIHFGQITISKAGVATRESKFLWPDFESYNVEEVRLILQVKNPDGSKRRTRKIGAPISTIENFYVLLGVLQKRDMWLRTEPTTVPSTR